MTNDERCESLPASNSQHQQTLCIFFFAVEFVVAVTRNNTEKSLSQLQFVWSYFRIHFKAKLSQTIAKRCTSVAFANSLEHDVLVYMLFASSLRFVLTFFHDSRPFCFAPLKLFRVNLSDVLLCLINKLITQCANKKKRMKQRQRVVRLSISQLRTPRRSSHGVCIALELCTYFSHKCNWCASLVYSITFFVALFCRASISNNKTFGNKKSILCWTKNENLWIETL